MTVRLALTPDSRWAIDTEDLVRVTHDAGFVGLGCPLGRASLETRSLYVASELECHEIMALVITDDAERTESFAIRLAEAAQAMHALWINTVFAVKPSGEAAQLLKRCAAVFADANTGMAVEFSPLGPVRTIGDGLEVVEVAGSGAGLMIDSWHFSFGPSTWEQLEAVPAEMIAYIQFGDAPDIESDDLWHETLNRRALPGDGRLPVDRFATTVQALGFEGYVSLEVLSAAWREVPVAEFVRSAYEATTRFWN
jgi:sugar phosphate isomerase/epimerase